MSDRPYDVVLFGATGFTGKLVANVLARRAPEDGATWAIAGRSRAKLEEVRRGLAERDEALADLPIKVADSADVAMLDALVPQAKVICTTVGPYAKHGLELAKACARHGTSYCDLTGEPNFVRASIDACHDLAKESGARIVHCAGYDSIPSDLGVLMAWDWAKRTHGEGLAWAKCFTGRTKGGPSGGTVASLLGVVEAARESAELRRILRNPHGLDPDPPPKSDPFEKDQVGVRLDPDAGGWTAPFVMAAINTRIVRRSHALLREEDGEGYGSCFRYHEAMGFPASAKGLAMASAVTAGMAAVLAAAAFAPARSLLASRIAPGEGPSPEAIAEGYFEMRVVAETESGRAVRGRVAGTSDPGYGETSKMLAETALCLAKDGPRLPDRKGVLTPASAIGMRLVERLRAAGMTFDVG